MEREPERRTRLWENARFFSEGLKALGLDTAGSQTPVVPVVVGSDDGSIEEHLRKRHQQIVRTALDHLSGSPPNCFQ